MISQTIFSENIVVEKEFKYWNYIVIPNKYSGWVPANSFVPLDEPNPTSLTVSLLVAHVYEIKDTGFRLVKLNESHCDFCYSFLSI